MSNATFAMPVSLDGPLPVVPVQGLLAVPGVVVDEPDARWMNGAVVYGYPEELPNEWEPCLEGTWRIKDDESTQSTPTFGAFVAYTPISCTAMSMGDPNEFKQRAEVVMEATASYAAEAQLARGVAIDNPSLGDANADILASGAAVSPEAGLSYLEDAIAATGRGGLIHATPGTASRWFSGDQMYAGPLRTKLGTYVAAGGGYLGTTPEGEAAAGSGQAWAFATGPVQVRIEAMPVLEIEDVLDRSNNDVTFRAERTILVSWDTALQAAVLIDWSP